MIRNLGIRAKVLIVLSAVAITAVGVNGYLGYRTAKESLEAESFNKLTAVREMKSSQIEDYFRQIADQVQTFSEDRMIIEAIKAFKSGFDAIETDLLGTTETPQHVDTDLRSYYVEEFQSRLQRNTSENVSVDRFWPTKSSTRFLQHLYLSSNKFETGSKHQLDSASDGSSYTKAHSLYHPIIRSYLEKFGYYDIFLVDHETGHIIYTVFKEVDYGTSLLTGPYKDTNFANAFRAAKNAADKDFVRLVDFAPYEPSYNAPAAFIASPIFEADQIIGVLLFQMPIDRINNIMTNKHAWADVGLGQSGETYIVGDDFLLRNQSRFLIEDWDNYFKVIQEIGLPRQTIDRINNLNSTIGLQPVKTQGTEAALRGETGTQIFPDYRGVSVLSSYKPVSIADVNWVIMSEIDEAEAFAQVSRLRENIFFWLIIVVIAIVIIALVFSTLSQSKNLQGIHKSYLSMIFMLRVISSSLGH
jgi:methyl-accepting chemotaxis protein